MFLRHAAHALFGEREEMAGYCEAGVARRELCVTACFLCLNRGIIDGIFRFVQVALRRVTCVRQWMRNERKSGPRHGSTCCKRRPERAERKIEREEIRFQLLIHHNRQLILSHLLLGARAQIYSPAGRRAREGLK